jgi:4-alpha-glucanotransferase
VWANPGLFLLGADARPTAVAGVPPDYFSTTGQRWGNPLYDWEALAATGYEWWIERLRATFAQVDIARIDHFRAFVDYWEIPATAPTAETGRWVDGPGRAFFTAAEAALGDLPIIAEDLGDLSPAVPALRDQLGLPGMKILQFGFGGEPDDAFLPHTYPEHCVAYTGTHDNDTTLGWYRSASRIVQRRARAYFGCTGREITQAMLAAVWDSKAVLGGATLQDMLNLGAEARMNTPGRAAGNWTWRVAPGVLDDVLAERVRQLNRSSRRLL